MPGTGREIESLEELRSQHAALGARIDALERQLSQRTTSGRPALSRRLLLQRASHVAVAGAAAVAAGAVAAPVVRAGNTDGGGLKLGSDSNTASTSTGVTSSTTINEIYALGVSDDDLTQIPGGSDGTATLAAHASRFGNAVLGYHAGSGNGVRGIGGGTNGWGVFASGKGKKGTGIYADGLGTGGRGGIFVGKVAQIQLKAGSLATHPPKGVRGDLYVDSIGRLWYCRTGGSSAVWKQLA